jgi:hypothetical protein
LNFQRSEISACGIRKSKSVQALNSAKSSLLAEKASRLLMQISKALDPLKMKAMLHH